MSWMWFQGDQREGIGPDLIQNEEILEIFPVLVPNKATMWSKLFQRLENILRGAPASSSPKSSLFTKVWGESRSKGCKSADSTTGLVIIWALRCLAAKYTYKSLYGVPVVCYLTVTLPLATILKDGCLWQPRLSINMRHTPPQGRH